LLVFTPLLAGSPSASLAVSEQVPIGARGIAMGGAFSSIADDATALFWNPAGLPRIGHQEIMGTHANLFNTGINDDVLAFALPLTLNQAAAVDWYHSGFDDSELDFGENRFDLSYGAKLNSYLLVGATLKYLNRQTNLDGSTVRRGGGAGMDFGLLATPITDLRLALVGQDAFNTRVTYASGEGTAVAYPRNVRVGASYTVLRGLTFAADVDDRWHLGAEYVPIEQVALRAGMEDDRKGPEPATYATGAGFKVGIFRFDYAYVMPPELSSTNHFSASIEFNFNPSQVRIEKVQANDFYASLYKTYASESFGSVRLRNLSERGIDAKLAVYVPELMDAPSEHDILIPPKASQAFPLTAVLSKKVMALNGNRPVQVHVTTSYRSVRLPRTDKASGRCNAYRPGALSWDGGVGPAAAFITTHDAVVDGFAREAGRIVALETRRPFENTNLAFTAAVFDALGELGLAYVPDPNNPYSSISETPHAVDTVQYPRETLAKRAGDCDDSSVLVAALLENVGIRTKLVGVPGHIFLLVDTGIPERNRLALGLPDELFTVRDDEVWVPLETTAVGKGFPEAWKRGAQIYQGAYSRGDVRLADVDSAQTRFEPAELPAPNLPPPPAPDSAQLRVRVADDARVVQSWREEYLASHFGEVQRTVEITSQAMNEVAHVCLLAGDLDQARAKLVEALQRDPRSARAHNNLGVSYAAAGDLVKAREYFEAALALDPLDAGVWLNLGIVRAAIGDTSGADKALTEGLTRSGGYAGACRLLGLPTSIEVGRQGMERMSAEEIRALLSSPHVPAREPTRGAPGIESGTPVAPPSVMGKPAGERVDVGPYLYWKN